MITKYIVFFISLWIHGCRSNNCDAKKNPFFMMDKNCGNFNDICVKKDSDACKSILQACAQCPASNLTESALISILKILRDQQNTTTSHFDARLNNFSLEMKSQMNQQNKTTEANYKKFEARLNKSEREILDKLALIKNISSPSFYIVIFIIVISVINFLVILFFILLVLIEMKWQPFKLFPRIAGAIRNCKVSYPRLDETNHHTLEGAFRNYEVTPLISNPRFDEKIHQTLAEDQIEMMPKTPLGAAAPLEQKNDGLSINISSKFYILELNAPKWIYFNVESGRVIQMHTRQITIKSIFDNIKEVLLSYSIVDSVGNIKKKIADLLSKRDKNKIPAINVILFCENKNLDDDVLLFDINMEQLKFCHLMPLVESNITGRLFQGEISKIYTYRDDSSSEELLLKMYRWEPMEILKENEAILNELITFQITKSLKGFVRLNGVFTDMDSFYISMEKMEESIKNYMAKNPPLSEEIIAKWTKQILSALKCLHHNGIIHRNIKPSSILLDKDKNIKLSSFGLGKHILWRDKKCLKMELPQSRLGTFGYMAPDICNNKNYGVQGDVWSFGVTMIEMATGKHPFDGWDNSKIIFEIVSTNQIPYKLDTTRSSNLKNFIDKCLIKHQKDRATVDDLLNHDFLHPK